MNGPCRTSRESPQNLLRSLGGGRVGSKTPPKPPLTCHLHFKSIQSVAEIKRAGSSYVIGSSRNILKASRRNATDELAGPHIKSGSKPACPCPVSPRDCCRSSCLHGTMQCIVGQLVNLVVWTTRTAGWRSTGGRCPDRRNKQRRSNQRRERRTGRERRRRIAPSIAMGTIKEP